jgi:aryl-alcohol dehydrogenase-like predicted oxidoreductase
LAGLPVSAIGLGAGALGTLPPPQGIRLVHEALDLGVGLIDSAPSYGASEEIVGRAIAGRDVVVSTKVGYGVTGVADWTGPCITRGIERARRRLGRDVIDVVHLHSCPASVLTETGVVDALLAAREAGVVRRAAYSGDGHALYVATQLGFDCVQATLSVLDRHNRPTLDLARRAGMGLLYKRVLGNAPWRFDGPPPEPDSAENFRRWRSMGLTLDDPADTFLRWALHHHDVDAVLVGTRSPDRLRAALRSVERGPLDPATIARLDAAWAEHGQSWAPLT